ncbi:MAG: alpha/beta fold hydrolase [Dehalococcoidia bacterium]
MSKNTGLPRNPRYNYHFKFRIFEFFFQWITGAQTSGCAEGGECFYTASMIKDGDGESWYNAFTGMGSRAEKRAEISSAGGHPVSARESYLRAYAYYRASIAFLDPFTDPRHLELYHKAVECFQKAAAMFGPPILPLKIPFEGRTLPGYLIRPANDDIKRKTLLMIGGADTFVEDLYGYVGPAAVKRNYNLVIVDLPGQGELPSKGLTMRPDSEVPVKTVVDFILQLPGVDQDKVVMYGLSFGGYLAPKAATLEKRIKALAVCSTLMDASRLWPDGYGKLDRSLAFKMLRVFLGRRFQSMMGVLHTYYWRWGVRDSAGLVRECGLCKFDPSLITCPFLNLVAQQEYDMFPAAQEWAKACLEKISNPENKLVIAPTNEGADSHGIGTNLSLMAQIVFDWFDEVLDK